MLKKLFNLKSKSDEKKFTGFGVFSNIHCYFREKYRTDMDHKDFYVCAGHFFKALMAVLEGVDFKEQVPSGSAYAKLYAELCASSPFNASVVEDYLTQLAHRANESASQSDLSEKMFYQRFLAREALPLLFSPDLSDEKFNTIITLTPGEMFLSEQELSCSENKPLLFSCLLIQLSDSLCDHAVERYSDIVTRFPVDNARTSFYLSSVGVLKSIFSENKIEIVDPSIASKIFEALLLSVRQKDQEKADIALRLYIQDISFVADTLCDAYFLHALGRKGLYGGRLGNTTHIEKLFVFFVWPESNCQNIDIVRRLNQAFLSYAENHDNEPLLHVAVSSQEGMRFFGLLDPKIAGGVYTEERLLSLLNKTKQRDYSELAHEKREAAIAKQTIRVAVLSFILQSLHPESLSEGVDYYKNIKEQTDNKVALTVNKRIEAYLQSRSRLDS